MKSLTISLAAAWAATIQSFVDGDVFRESNIDLQIASIGDRLGYLKTKADAAGYLAAAAQTWTGLQTVSGAAGGIAISGDQGLVLSGGGTLQCGVDAEFTGPVACQDTIDINGALYLPNATLADANATIATYGLNRVPQLTANRSYTMPGGGGSTLAVISASAAGWVELQDANGAVIRITRSRTADAFTVTILGTPGSGANQWRVSAWGGTVTSLDTTA